MNVHKALTKVSSFGELAPLAHNAQEKISLRGRRYLVIQGYQGALPIDALALKVLTLVKKNPHFDEEARQHGRKIAPHITRIFEQSDKRLKNKNILTRFLCAIRGRLASLKNSLFGPHRQLTASPTWTKRIQFENYGPRGEWLGAALGKGRVSYSGESDCFEYYTLKQYETVFGPFTSAQPFGTRGGGGFPQRMRPPIVQEERANKAESESQVEQKIAEPEIKKTTNRLKFSDLPPPPPIPKASPQKVEKAPDRKGAPIFKKLRELVIH